MDPGANFGGMLGRLFLRTLPDQYAANSAYAWFPLITPASLKTSFTHLGISHWYDWQRPSVQVSCKIVRDYATIAEMLKNPADFKIPYTSRAATIINGSG